VSAFLELQLLRAEVRAVRGLADEVSELRQEVKRMKQLMSEVGDAVPITDQGEFPPLQCPSCTVVGTKADGSTSSARHANNLVGNESSMKIATNKPAKRPVIGASSVNQHVKAVPTTRQVDMFVSRLDPHTYVNSILGCVQEMKRDVKVVDVECNPLKS